MKICRHGPREAEEPGIVDAEGRIRDLSPVVDEITPATLPGVTGTPRDGVPLKGIGKIVAIGLDYEDDAIGSDLPIPTEPVMFMKAHSSLTGQDDEVMLPQDATHGDWEVKLGVMVGKTCRYVEEADALDHIAGYVLANDVSERFNEKQRGLQWSKGKGHDTFCPVGSGLVTPDEAGDPQDLDMSLDLNGQRVQTGNTRTMIFPVREIIAYLSRYVTLYPGDLVITGTPPGVGEGKPEPVFHKPGDEVRLTIGKLGTQTQQVAVWRQLGDEVPA